MMARVSWNEVVADEDIARFFLVSSPADMSRVTTRQIQLYKRPDLLHRDMFSRNPFVEPYIRVLSWNILSQSLAMDVDNFPQDDRTLVWRDRRIYILKEMCLHSPAVLGLQECDRYELISAAMESLGYEGQFLEKPNSPCLYVRGNNGPDGVALFFNSARFESVRWVQRNLKVFGLKTNQVILGVILRNRTDGIEIFVAVTHLVARSGEVVSAIRDVQMQDVLEWVAREAGDRPTILLGGFNTLPTEAAYNRVMAHRKRFSSAYAVDGVEPEYTTWKLRNGREVKETVDYIFHTRNMSVCTTLSIPKGEELGPKKLPNERYPSDHVALVADLAFNDTFHGQPQIAESSV